MSDLYTLTSQECAALDDELQSMVARTYGMGLSAVWCQIDSNLSFSKRKSEFLYVLDGLLGKGIIKIGRMHKLINVDKEVIRKQFEMAWPSGQEFDDDQFSTVMPYRSDVDLNWHTHYWTPGDAVWINESGA